MKIRYTRPLGNEGLIEHTLDQSEVVGVIIMIKKELDSLLVAPFGVDVVNDAGDRVNIAYDDYEGFMMFESASGDSIRYTLGNIDRSDVKAFLCSDWTEMSGKYMVPSAQLLDALSEWSQQGKLSKLLNWTTEIY